MKPAPSINLRYRGNLAAYLAMLAFSPAMAPSPELPTAQGISVATSTSLGSRPARFAPSATWAAAVSACSRVHQVISAPWAISPQTSSILGKTAATYMGISLRKGSNQKSKFSMS